MGIVRNITKKVLIVALLYAGERLAAKVAGKVMEIAAKKKAGTS